MAQALITNQVDFTHQPAAGHLPDGPRARTRRSSPTPAARSRTATSTGGRPRSTSTTSVQPFDDPDVRWALSYYIDRQQIVDVGWAGAGAPSPLPMPSYPALQPVRRRRSRTCSTKYPTLEFDPKKGDALLEKKGWKKGSDGMWADASGSQAQARDHRLRARSPAVGPVVSRAAEAGRASTPRYVHAAGLRRPLPEGRVRRHALRPRRQRQATRTCTLRLYQSADGGRARAPTWSNFSEVEQRASTTQIVDEMAITPP